MATPLAFTLAAKGRPLKPNHKLLWWIIGLSSLAVLSVGASVLMLSMGSRYGASGDIGGIAMWLLSTGGLLVAALVATTSLPRADNVPGPQ